MLTCNGPASGILPFNPRFKIKIKINSLTACRLADTGRAHPLESLETLGGPTQKKNKKIQL
jgi:hypothetical protein